MIYTLTSNVILQPETGPIPQEHLIADLKGIYDGPEAKCIEVDDKQATNQATLAQANGVKDQQSAIITLQRTLLHEHHDFFLASQHPLQIQHTVSWHQNTLFILVYGAMTYLHAFLELLRHRFPTLSNHILALNYMA